MKVWKFIKSNFLGFIIGGIIFGSLSGVIAASLAASDVQYKSNKTVKDAIDELYKLSNKPYVYWFDTSGTYTFPNYGGTLQISGTATGHNVYIGQDATKYYACLNYNGKEVCLSQPYTQYGLEGHTLNSSFTTEEQNAAKAAIGEVFSDAGITGYGCESYSSAFCRVGDFGCSVYSNGDINCRDNVAGEICNVYADGSANCS